MAFKTKLDFSSNRQVKQHEKTITALSGGTSFGLTYSAMTAGPNYTTSAVTQNYTSITGYTSTFSGNNTTTNYVWFDTRMSLAESTFSAITSSTSAYTQTTNAFIGDTSTVIDSNLVNLTYSGVSFDMTPLTVIDLGGGNYSGTVKTYSLDILSADTLDYTGRTIWNDVSGITRTERLIITNNPQVGYVWTCLDSEGMGVWSASSGSSGPWTSSTGTNSAILIGSGSIATGTTAVAEGTNTQALGDYSHAEGGGTIASGNYSHSEGQGNLASGLNSHAEGQANIASGDTSHAEGISTIAGGSYSHAEGDNTAASGQSSHAEGTNTQALGDYSHAEGLDTLASGFVSHAEGSGTTANGFYSHAEGYGSVASGISSHAEGESTTAYGDYSHAGGRNTIAEGNYSFIHSYQSKIVGNRSAVIGGQNITGYTNDTVYVPNLIINTGGTTSVLGVNTDNPEYPLDVYSTNSRMFYRDSLGGQIIVSGVSSTSSLPRISVVDGVDGPSTLASIEMGVRSWSDVTYPNYGNQGDAWIYSGVRSNGLNIISSDGGSGSGEDYIRFYVGQAAGANPSNTPDLHIQGTGTTRGYVGVGVTDPTQQLDVSGNSRIRNIGSSASSGALHYTSNGTLTTNTSDERLKTNIQDISNALDKIKQLRGVTYNWTESPSGDTRIGFIAQEVDKVVPELTFTNNNSPEKYMGVHYDNITALLVEAIKELSNNPLNNTYLETQTILAEDNNIDLNYSGTPETAVGGGIRVLHALGTDKSAEFVTDSDGNFITNNDFKAKSLTIPLYTPTSSLDEYGNEGNITRDDNYLYIKTIDGWKRTNLESF